MEATGGINQEKIGAFSARSFKSAIGKPRRIGTLPAAHHRHAHPLAPDRELLHSCGAEGVARREQNRQPGVFGLLGELADGRGLAGAVDPAHEHHLRAIARPVRDRLCKGFEDGGNALG